MHAFIEIDPFSLVWSYVNSKVVVGVSNSGRTLIELVVKIK